MYIKLDYFYFLAFDLEEVNSTEIWKYILSFSGEEPVHGWGTNHQIFEKY